MPGNVNGGPEIATSSPKAYSCEHVPVTRSPRQPDDAPKTRMCEERPVESPSGQMFGEVLAELRRAADLSRAALAERAELSPRSIRNLEGGVHQPYADTIRR